jgi:hypothetical protein
MSDKPFDAEECDIGGHASATNGLSDMKTHIKNAPCNRPLMRVRVSKKNGYPHISNQHQQREELKWVE